MHEDLIGLISDAHGNLEAYESALATLRARGAIEFYFLGDAVGYLPGDAVVDALARDGVHPIRGNHEDMLLNDALSRDAEAVYRLMDTRHRMRAELLTWIATWPPRRELEASAGRLVMVHGSVEDPTHGYVYPDTPLTDLDSGSPTTVFMGATHRPFVRKVGETTYVNVGSCGLPRDRGDLGAACLFDPNSGTASILRFDITSEIERALSRCGPVHETVVATFGRRGEFVGELV
jgi:predicted phosphodiesterase